MSYKDFEEALSLLDLYNSRCLLISPQSNDHIRKSEKILGVNFPKSYKFFLQKYGCLFFGGEHILGTHADGVVKFSQDLRVSDPKLPKTLIPIHELGNGEISCLDTARMDAEDECPVVAWFFGATFPNGKLEVLAEDFGAFLLEKVRWGLEAIEEDEKGKNP